MRFPTLLLLSLLFVPFVSASFVDVLEIDITDGDLFITDSYENDFSYYDINGTNFSKTIVLIIDEECETVVGHSTCSPSLVCAPNSSFTCQECPEIPKEPFGNVDNCLQLIRERGIAPPQNNTIIIEPEEEFYESKIFLYFLIFVAAVVGLYAWKPHLFEGFFKKDEKPNYTQIALEEKEEEVRRLNDKLVELENEKQKKEIEDEKINLDKKEAQRTIDDLKEEINHIKDELAKKKKEDAERIIHADDVEVKDDSISKEREEEIEKKINEAFKKEKK